MVKINHYRQLTIHCLTHNYPIYLGHGLLANPELLRQHILGNQALIVTNDTVGPLYLTRIQENLSELQCDVVILSDGEKYKNQDSLSSIYDVLMQNQHHRDTTLIALGGGVVGDITGFAAATFQRGVRFIQIPTTLLAQVDASIGGKTAINYKDGKNMVGCFHQPQAVIIDIDTLKTLNIREVKAGLAEIIKYALLVGGEFLLTLDQLFKKNQLDVSGAEFLDIITKCCEIKAEFVQKDEKEIGVRALLNLGHTFAHALEAATRYERWLHGEAVAIGIYCAALLSFQLGYLEKKALTYIDSLLINAKLPHRIPKDIDLLELQLLMFNDKKIMNKQLRFVLIKKLGECFVDNKVTQDDIHQVLKCAIEGDDR